MNKLTTAKMPKAVVPACGPTLLCLRLFRSTLREVSRTINRIMPKRTENVKTAKIVFTVASKTLIVPPKTGPSGDPVNAARLPVLKYGSETNPNIKHGHDAHGGTSCRGSSPVPTKQKTPQIQRETRIEGERL
jgi:hypothetical protein